MESKLQLLGRMLSTRKEMKPEDVEEKSCGIQRRVVLMPEFRESLRLGLYAEIMNEVGTGIVFEEARIRRKEIYYPALDEDADEFKFFRVLDISELKPGVHGAREPGSTLSQLRDVNTLDALIVPGVAFDLHGGRIGAGRGHYDKCLVGFRGRRVALAYEFQIVPDLPTAARGRKVDWIVTESRIIRCQ